MIERRFRAVPGVIDIAGWGGRIKTYDVTVNLVALVVVGGILLGPILILIILPVMIDVFTPLEAIAPIGEATPEPGE